MTGFSGTAGPTRLRLGFKPDTVSVDLTVNGPGDPFHLDQATVTAQLADPRLPACGEVLAGVLDGDPLLSVRGDTAEDCWRILAPVLEAWRNDDVPMETYPTGSRGPTAGGEFPDA